MKSTVVIAIIFSVFPGCGTPQYHTVQRKTVSEPVGLDSEILKTAQKNLSVDDYFTGCASRYPDNAIRLEGPMYHEQRCTGKNFGYLASYELAFWRRIPLVSLDVNIRIDQGAKESVRNELKKKYHAAADCARKIYARHGIILHLKENWLGKTQHSDARYNNNIITIYERDSTKFGTDSHEFTFDPRVSPDNLCIKVAHELSHHIGLPDTYPRSECPDRDSKDPSDLMYLHVSTEKPDQKKLSRDQMREIFKPLCGETD